MCLERGRRYSFAREKKERGEEERNEERGIIFRAFCLEEKSIKYVLIFVYPCTDFFLFHGQKSVNLQKIRGFHSR